MCHHTTAFLGKPARRTSFLEAFSSKNIFIHMQLSSTLSMQRNLQGSFHQFLLAALLRTGIWDATPFWHEQHLQGMQGSILTRAPRARRKCAESCADAVEWGHTTCSLLGERTSGRTPNYRQWKPPLQLLCHVPSR